MIYPLLLIIAPGETLILDAGAIAHLPLIAIHRIASTGPTHWRPLITVVCKREIHFFQFIDFEP